MRNLLCFGILFFVLGVVGAKAQCVVPAGFVCFTQADADRISADLAELKQSRIVIADFKNERLLTATQEKAADTLIAAMDVLVAKQNKVISDYDGVLASMQKVFDAQAILIEKLTTALNKPKSKWHEFLDVLKRVGDIVVGIAIGRHF